MSKRNECRDAGGSEGALRVDHRGAVDFKTGAMTCRSVRGAAAASVAAALLLCGCAALGDLLTGPVVDSPEYVAAAHERDVARSEVDRLAAEIDAQRQAAEDAAAQAGKLADELATRTDVTPERLAALERGLASFAKAQQYALAREGELREELEKAREDVYAATLRAQAPPGQAVGDAVAQQVGGSLGAINPMMGYLAISALGAGMAALRRKQRAA